MAGCDKKTRVLKEFCEDIEAVGLEYVRKEWPDLVLTYRNAQAALSGGKVYPDPRRRRAKRG